MEESRILDLLWQRSESAITVLDELWGGLCRNIARNILSDEADVEECIQDTWLAVWHAIPPQRPWPLRPWVCKVTRNLALKKHHRNTAQKRDGRHDAALEELEGCLPHPGTVEDALSEKELTRLLNAFLAGLDKDSRLLFVRRYWYGDGVEALAKTLGLRPNTVSVRLSRIRAKLKTYLEKEGYSL